MACQTNVEHEFKRGQALVIVGDQGCGKTTLARKIAEKTGRFIETDASRIEAQRDLVSVLLEEPDTVICDGFPESDESMERIKLMISSKSAAVGRNHESVRIVKTPNFIFFTGDPEPIQMIGDDRRFHVIEFDS